MKKFILYTLFFSLIPAVVHGGGLEERVVEHTLSNGLKLLLVPRQSSPTVATAITFKVGSVDEQAGLTGIAHMLEHMLFKGTKTLGTVNWAEESPLLEKIEKVAEALDKARKKEDREEIDRLSPQLAALQKEHKKFVIKDEFAELYAKNGGIGYNAWTSSDATSYIIKLPANKLKLWAVIESDRMKNPILREFYQERDVIMEERRSSYDNNPSGSLYENLLSAAFKASPYHHPTIGWASDIRYLPKKKVQEFLDTYYAPNNCVIAIAGDIEPKKVIAMIEYYFGTIPSREIPPRIVTRDPEQKGEKRVEVEFDANDEVLIAYHKPNAPDKDDFTFDVIDSVLSGGRTSRLYKRLVLEEKVAVSVGTFSVPGSRHPNLFVISATPRAPHKVAELEKIIYEEIEKLKNQPLAAKEFEKILNQLEASKIRRMKSNMGMASELAYYQTILGDWHYLVDHIDRIKEVTPERVMEAAKKYLRKGNRTVATLVKK